MIEAVNGKSVSGYTVYPNENEVLLAPGTRLCVVSNALDHVGGLHVVHLKEVADQNGEQLPPISVSITEKPLYKEVIGKCRIHL